MSSAGTGDSGLPLPRRVPPPTSEGGTWTAAPVAQRSRGLVQVVDDALRAVSGKEANVSGMLLASADGLVLASDTHDEHLDTVAAMAAAAASLAGRFTDLAAMGMAKAAMFEGSTGHVAVFPLEPRVLLVVFGRQGTTMGLFNIAARNALSLLQQEINRQWVLSARYAPHMPGTPGR
jgi:predicted regulator of Ras-like GTPase activity (Roadblock/LC7/MglB family)